MVPTGTSNYHSTRHGSQMGFFRNSQLADRSAASYAKPEPNDEELLRKKHQYQRRELLGKRKKGIRIASWNINRGLVKKELQIQAFLEDIVALQEVDIQTSRGTSGLK
jgi:hypothetical protein